MSQQAKRFVDDKSAVVGGGGDGDGGCGRLKMGRRLRNTFGRKAIKRGRKLESCPETEDHKTDNNHSDNEDDVEDTLNAINYSGSNRMSIDYPPQIRFYQNTLTPGRQPTVRPTMMDLIRDKTVPENGGSVDPTAAVGVNSFQERNQYVLDCTAATPTTPSIGWRQSARRFGAWRLFGSSKSLAYSEKAVKVVATPLPSSSSAVDTAMTAGPTKKFGWIEGVLIRCMASIFGVMLYLRISWVAGQCGLLLGSCVILLGTVITTITALSTSAICTNGVVKGGGAYYLISRSLGPEFGGSIGVIFSLANAVGAAMYLVGFAETMLDIFAGNGISIIDGGLNDVRIIGIVACVLVIGVIIVGLSFESKMQIVLMVVLYASLLDYLIGTFFEPTAEQRARGITGYRLETIKENLMPMFRDGYDFFGVFSVYFPASTGIMAGANISGDLRNPQQAIPLGTLLAIFVTSLIYLAMLWMSGATNVRDADGVHFPQLLALNDSIVEALTAGGGPPTMTLPVALELQPTNAVIEYVRPACAYNATCEYGLLNYFQIVRLGSFFGPFVTLSIATSTLSSALVSMVGAPKIFQAVARDKLFPYIRRFASGHGPNQEPRAALVLCSIIAFAIILIGELNVIAPIISNFFLCSYALINYACFDNSFAHSPGFRPSFRYYNMWVSLAGAFMCICVMFIISWTTALLTFFFFALIFVYLSHRKPEVNWGTSTQAHCYRNALQYVSRLERIDEHVKNYRPQILVLSGNPAARLSLTEFAYSITKGSSLMLSGYVVPYAPCKTVFAMSQKLNELLRVWFKSRHIKAFPVTVANSNFRAGVQALIQTVGLGKLRPNIVLMGYRNVWQDNENARAIASGGGACEPRRPRDVDDARSLAALLDYFGVIEDAFINNLSLGILRNGNAGLDVTDQLLDTSVVEGDGNPSSAETTPPAVTADAVQKAIAKGFAPIRSTAYTISEEPSLSSTRRNSSSTLSTAISATTMNTMASTAPLTSGRAPDTSSERAIDVSDAPLPPYVGDATQSLAARPARNRPTVMRRTSLFQPGESIKDVEEGRPCCEDVGVQTITPPGGNSRRVSQQHNPFGPAPSLDAFGRASDDYTRFQRRVRHGRIDVWWLYDDGGLTLLVPYLLAQPKSYLEGAHLRVFTVSNAKRGTVLQEQQNLVSLLAKFRINAASVTVVSDRPGRRPSEKGLARFNELIAPFMAKEPVSPTTLPPASDGSSLSLPPAADGRITAAELKAHEQKTWRQLRLAEMLALHSSSADLIVVTLPVPRSGAVSAPLYMAWLDVISRDLPPTLMLRGNQQSVLTFYS